MYVNRFFLACLILLGCTADQDSRMARTFFDDFENGLGKWELNNPAKLPLIDSGDPGHGTVLGLYPAGPNVHALIKGSDDWSNVRIEGDVLFPEDKHNYLGIIYNYNVRGTRVDYGCIYIKGNGSYVRVNPHRDGHVSRTLHEEYRTPLTGESAIVIGEWQHFRIEIIGPACHFYVGDMETPKITFDFHEFTSGRVGFEPRVSGSECWIDNISVTPIEEFGYQGALQPPGIAHKPHELITRWQAIGPFMEPVAEIEEQEFTPDNQFMERKQVYTWQPFEADGRGCTVGGRIIEWMSGKNFAYFYSQLDSDRAGDARLQFSSTNQLKVWLNNEYVGEVEKTRFAWYDFWENPEHAGTELQVTLREGANHLLVLEEGLGWGGYSGDGFYARLSTE